MPVEPVRSRQYHCGARFKIPQDMLECDPSDQRTGAHVLLGSAPFVSPSLTLPLPVAFIVVDGHGATVATLKGRTRRTLATITCFLPKKQPKGGQSAPRFGRQRL